MKKTSKKAKAIETPEVLAEKARKAVEAEKLKIETEKQKLLTAIDHIVSKPGIFSKIATSAFRSTFKLMLNTNDSVVSFRKNIGHFRTFPMGIIAGIKFIGWLVFSTILTVVVLPTVPIHAKYLNDIRKYSHHFADPEVLTKVMSNEKTYKFLNANMKILTNPEIAKQIGVSPEFLKNLITMLQGGLGSKLFKTLEPFFKANATQAETEAAIVNFNLLFASEDWKNFRSFLENNSKELMNISKVKDLLKQYNISDNLISPVIELLVKRPDLLKTLTPYFQASATTKDTDKALAELAIKLADEGGQEIRDFLQKNSQELVKITMFKDMLVSLKVSDQLIAPAVDLLEKRPDLLVTLIPFFQANSTVEMTEKALAEFLIKFAEPGGQNIGEFLQNNFSELVKVTMFNSLLSSLNVSEALIKPAVELIVKRPDLLVTLNPFFQAFPFSDEEIAAIPAGPDKVAAIAKNDALLEAQSKAIAHFAIKLADAGGKDIRDFLKANAKELVKVTVFKDLLTSLNVSEQLVEPAVDLLVMRPDLMVTLTPYMQATSTDAETDKALAEFLNKFAEKGGADIGAFLQNNTKEIMEVSVFKKLIESFNVSDKLVSEAVKVMVEHPDIAKTLIPYMQTTSTAVQTDAALAAFITGFTTSNWKSLRSLVQNNAQDMIKISVFKKLLQPYNVSDKVAIEGVKLFAEHPELAAKVFADYKNGRIAQSFLEIAAGADPAALHMRKFMSDNAVELGRIIDTVFVDTRELNSTNKYIRKYLPGLKLEYVLQEAGKAGNEANLRTIVGMLDGIKSGESPKEIAMRTTMSLAKFFTLAGVSLKAMGNLVPNLRPEFLGGGLPEEHAYDVVLKKAKPGDSLYTFVKDDASMQAAIEPLRRVIQRDFSYKKFTEATRFTDLKIERFTMFDCEFSSASFERSEISDCEFNGSKFTKVNFRGAALTICNLSNITEFNGVSFENAAIAGCTFGGSKFSKCVFKGAKFLQCDFSNITLDQETLASFAGASMDTMSFKSFVQALKNNVNLHQDGKLVIPAINLKGEYVRFNFENMIFDGTNFAEITNANSVHGLAVAEFRNSDLSRATGLNAAMLSKAANLQAAILPANLADFGGKIKAELVAKVIGVSVESISELLKSTDSIGDYLRKTIDSSEFGNEVAENDMMSDSAANLSSSAFIIKSAMKKCVVNGVLNEVDFKHRLLGIKFADYLCKQLYDEGIGRGKDVLKLHEFMYDVIKKSGLKVEQLSQFFNEDLSKPSPDFERLFAHMLELVGTQTVSTNMGQAARVASLGMSKGGVQFSSDLFDNPAVREKMINSMTGKLEEFAKIDKTQLHCITIEAEAITQGVAVVLWGDEATKSGKADDCRRLKGFLTDELTKIISKENDKEKAIKSITEHRSDIIGKSEVNKGMFYNSSHYTALCEQIYGATKLYSSGYHLKPDFAKDEVFVKSIDQLIQSAITQPEIGRS
jgi:uncharacterized protein YjbI with pentapeptide repeats